MKNDRLIILIALIGMMGMLVLSMALFNSFKEIKRLRLELNAQNVVDENDNIDSSSELEDFDAFIYQFATDSTFQVQRIQFPLKVSLFTDIDKPELDTVWTKKDWKFDNLYLNDEYTVQTYDNFDRQLRNTSERLLFFLGVENGISIEYLFKRLKGKWFLCEYQDDST